MVHVIARLEHKSPIQLTGPDFLSYDHISAFMNTRKKVIKVDAYIAPRLAVEDGYMIAGNVLTTRKVDVAIRLRDISYSTV